MLFRSRRMGQGGDADMYTWGEVEWCGVVLRPSLADGHFHVDRIDRRNMNQMGRELLAAVFYVPQTSCLHSSALMAASRQ